MDLAFHSDSAYRSNQDSGSKYRIAQDSGLQIRPDYHSNLAQDTVSAYLTESGKSFNRPASGDSESEQSLERSASNKLFAEAESQFIVAALGKRSSSRDRKADESEITRRKDKNNSERGSEKGETAEKILKAAESLRGEQLWYPKYAEDTKNGSLGCAISVSAALRKAGIKGVDMNTSVRGLVADLNALDNWKRYPIEEAQPGDIAVGHNTKLGSNHVGIISRDGGIWNNSSRALPQNTWINEMLLTGLRPAWLFDGYDKRYVLRPPG